jgi:FMN reductase
VPTRASPSKVFLRVSVTIMRDFSSPGPLIVGIGGTAQAVSSTEQALDVALDAAAATGARIERFGHRELVELPHFLTVAENSCTQAQRLIAAVREADGIILASPGYHGSISGLVKNAIDYLELTSKDERPYLHGLPVGLIVTAYGWQATGSTLVALRSIVHALRGWPTPFGCTVNTSKGMFKDGICLDSAVADQLATVGRQVVEFVGHRAHGGSLA